MTGLLMVVRPARLPRLLLLLALTLLGTLAGPDRAQAFSVGMSDQKLGMWQDPRFAQLGVSQVRLLVYYDLVLNRDFRRYDAWMAAAHARGADVLLTINHHSADHPRLPSVAQYRRVVRILRARYPWVTAMSAWNEANHPSQPTQRNPKRAARYFHAMRDECPACRVVAADLLDSANMLPWLAAFKRHARRPRLWGLHSYQDANHFRPLHATGTARFLAATRGEVWLTEAGGIVRFGRSYAGGRRGERRAARAMRRTFVLARSSPRITRAYLYHWSADRKFLTWDSALVGPNGRARPALGVVRAELNRQRRVARQAPVPALARFPRALLPL
jgi:hypothetical protein